MMSKALIMILAAAVVIGVVAAIRDLGELWDDEHSNDDKWQHT